MKNDMIKMFSELKEVITKDGKIDYSETEILNDFIEKYISEKNMDIIEFQIELYKCREDGKISDEESKILIEALNKLPGKLKRKKIMNLIYHIFGIGLIIAVFLEYIFGYFRNLIER